MSNGPYLTGLPIELINKETVRAEEDFSVLAAADIDIVNEIVTPSGLGSFTLPFTIPISERNKTITWTFTELSTNDQVVLTDVAPGFNQNITLNIDQKSQPAVAGADFVTGSVQASFNYGITIDLVLNNISYGSVSLSEVKQLTNFSIPIEIETPLGQIQVVAKADIHNTAVTALPYQILEGIEIDVPGVAFYNGGTFTFSGLGPANETLTLDVWGQTLTTTVNADKTWSIDVTPTSQPFGSSLATASSLAQTTSVSVNIADLSFTLDFCPTSFETNTASGNFASFSGVLEPGKTLTVTHSGINRAPDLVQAGQDGTWRLQFAQPWEPPGTYQATFTVPGEAGAVCQGPHSPDFRTIPGSLSFVQGSSGNSIQIRTIPNAVFSYNITGPLEDSGTVTTTALGFATIPVPDVDEFQQVPANGAIIVGTETVPYLIRAATELAVNVLNPSETVGSQVILFTNSTFNLNGDVPTNGVVNFSAVGEVDSLAITDPQAWTGILNTTATPGIIDFTISAFAQESLTETWIVSPPISFNIPQDLLKPNSYQLSITTEPNEDIELRIIGEVDGEIEFITTTSGPSGVFTYTFDTANLTPEQELTFFIRNKYFAFSGEERTLRGISDPLDSPTIGPSARGSNSNTSYAPSSVTFGLDNQPIEEFGAPYTSGFSLAWTEPVAGAPVRYAVDIYVPGQGYQEDAITAEPFIIPTTAPGYRVRALGSSQFTETAAFAAAGAATLAKTPFKTGLYTRSYTSPINNIEPASFFTQFTNRLENDIIEAGGHGRGYSSPINNIEPASFFTQFNNQQRDERFDLGALARGYSSPLFNIESATFFTNN